MDRSKRLGSAWTLIITRWIGRCVRHPGNPALRGPGPGGPETGKNSWAKLDAPGHAGLFRHGIHEHSICLVPCTTLLSGIFRLNEPCWANARAMALTPPSANGFPATCLLLAEINAKVKAIPIHR
jgi:hypothetical protein